MLRAVYIAFFIAVLFQVTRGHGHHDHDHDHGDCPHHHHHGHSHGSSKSKWEQQSEWKFEEGSYTVSMPLDGAKPSVMMSFEPSADGALRNAKKLWNSFPTVFQDIFPTGKLSPAGALYRLNRAQICSGHGHAHGNHCHCNKGFQVDPKDPLKCIPVKVECSGHGHAHGDHCHCNKGYEQDKYDKLQCIPVNAECSGHGHSHGDHCHCNKGYEQDQNDKLKCVPVKVECSGHGHAHGDHCHCDQGYEQDENDKLKCVQKVCGGFGHLHDGHCHCDEGYAPDEHNPAMCVPAEATFELIVKTAGLYTAFLDAELAVAGLKIMDSDGKLVEFTLAGDKERELPEITFGRVLSALGAALVVSLTALTGIVFLSCNRKRVMVIVDYMTSFAAGSCMAVVIFHIYPESAEYLGDKPAWHVATCFVAGALLGMLIELGLHILLHKHGADHHHHDHSHEKESIGEALIELPVHNEESVEQKQKKAFFDLGHIKPVAWIVAIGDFTHAFTDGAMIGIAFRGVDPAMGWLITLSVVMHEIPHRLGDFFVFMKAGMRVTQAVALDFVSSLSTFIGVVAMISIGSISRNALGYMLSCGSGTLLFIAFTELLPPMLRIMELKKAVLHLFCFLLGVTIVAILTLHHVHVDPETGEAHSH